MERTVVRLERILIENFKNVKRGSLDFANTRKPYRASILGLYGQNGSGKTALIDAMEILRLAQASLFLNCLPTVSMSMRNVQICNMSCP